MITLKDRILGSLLAGALGDAMGSALENRSGEIDPFSIPRWEISDDTQLTLATCAAIRRDGEVRASGIAESLKAAFVSGTLRGLGSSTLGALRSLAAGGHWASSGIGGEMAAGNGAAMRIAPLAFLCDPEDPSDRRRIRDVCRITHRSDESYLGALAVVLAIRLAAFRPGVPLEHLLVSVVDGLPDSRVRDRIVELEALAAEVDLSKIASEYGSSGYVVESVPLALRIVESFSNGPIDDALVATVELGGDTDTNASIVGQILGARLGAGGLPRELTARVNDWKPVEAGVRGFVESIADRSRSL